MVWLRSTAGLPTVASLATPLADPDRETLRQKINELLAALRGERKAGKSAAG